MIAVIGEALFDLVVGGDGDVAAHPGGGPFNTARALARLGVPSAFAGGLSDDGLGRQLRARLDADGVLFGLPSLSGRPATLSIADLDDDGVARYRFYLDQTAAADVEYDTLWSGLSALPGSLAAVHVGALGLVAEPVASSCERLITSGLPAQTLVMVDPNCRPGAIGDRGAYMSRLFRIMERADIVKASADDLAYLMPGEPIGQAAGALLDQGAALVIVTDGPRPAAAFLPSGREIRVDVPVVEVADTIGAGDAFGGAFLAYWFLGERSRTNGARGDGSCAGLDRIRAGFTDTGAIRDALTFAVEAAALTTTRPGAEPPRLAELTSRSLRWTPGRYGRSSRLIFRVGRRE
ncbi:MAG: carbohydrate kinase family protein [Trebonia sp.]